jgi:hypothetical protein
MMGTSIQHVDAEREHRLESARAELAAAEDALAAFDQGVDTELAVAALFARRRSLRDDAVRILGRDPGDDLEWGLRHHRVEVRGSHEATHRLRSALEVAGVALGDDEPPERMLVDIAQIWLDEQQETNAQLVVLTRDMAELETALHLARQATGAARSEDGADETSDHEREVDRARAALQEAEARLQRQSEVGAEVARRKEELAAALDAEQVATGEVAAAEGGEAEMAQVEHEAAAEQSRLQAELATTFAAERDIADALHELTQLLESGQSGEDRAEREAAARDASGAVSAAESDVAAGRGELAEVDRRLEELPDDDAGGSEVTSTEAVAELEWYLLSRLASHRSLSYAGSLPFVLDDALRGVRGEGLTHLLGRLERMSGTVQVIILSEDNEIAGWADAIGTDRAITLYPAPLDRVAATADHG